MSDSDFDESDSKNHILVFNLSINQLYNKYKQIKQAILFSENKSPIDVIQRLQVLCNLKQRQSRNVIETQSEVKQEKQGPKQSKSVSRKIIFQKPPSTASLSYADSLERENQQLRSRIVQACQVKDEEDQKILLENRKLTVKVENLETENKKLKSQYLKCFAELKVMKEKEAEEEKMQWHREALSDKNPYLMEQFRKKIDEKEKEIKRLAKNLKKVIIAIKQTTIMEKKLWVKEKAFEVERSEYLDRILYLSSRLGLTKVE